MKVRPIRSRSESGGASRAGPDAQSGPARLLLLVVPVTAAGGATVAAAAVLAMLLLSPASIAAADKEYAVRGLVIGVDPARKSMTVSHDRIPGFMDAMTMPFEVEEASELRGVVPGAIVEFTLVVGARRAHATRISVRQYEPVECDRQA